MDRGATRADIYDRVLLRAGNRIDGPAIVTEMDSTTLVLPGHRAEVDTYGNLIIRPIDDAAA
jgi:N-methylhydantoinase A